jgi:hypothetical protein
MEAWEKSEQKTAKTYGRRVPMSGSSPGEKLDIKGENLFEGYRIENKYTDKESYALTLKTLNKMIKQGRSMLASTFLLLDFGGRQRFVILEEEEFLSLFDGRQQ